MSDTEEYLSYSESEDIQDVSEDSDSEEIVSSGLVKPYQDEPRAHSSDEEGDEKEDNDSWTFSGNPAGQIRRRNSSR